MPVISVNYMKRRLRTIYCATITGRLTATGRSLPITVLQATATAHTESWKCRYLEVPDEVRFGMVEVELVIKQLPVCFAFDALAMFAQNNQLLLRHLLL